MRKDELYDYLYRDFLNLPNDERELYKAYGLKARAKNLVTTVPLEWQWGKIKQIQDIISLDWLRWDDLTEIIMLALDKTREEVLDMKWFEVARFYSFILESIKEINEKEKQLNYEPDAKEMAAGIDRFQQFSWFATLDRVAGGDVLKYEEVSKQPYSVIFSRLLLQKTEAEYNKALIRQNHV